MEIFEIYGEQKTLTQWDVGRRMQVNAVCQQLHFASEGAREAVVCLVQETDGVRTARIPDELLQVSGTLWVYAYVAAEEDYTKKVASFFVKERPQPAGYIYTPTQRVTLEEVMARMEALENREETDPTVPAWAKKNQKPAYTAEEVGARPGTWMPTASEIGAVAIWGRVAGDVVTFTDADNAPLRSLTLYGKTIQNGTPTPENPAALESMGASGSIIVGIYDPSDDMVTQSLSVSTPNGLPGIPVSGGGNYTDENGQQWICDEVDFARGVYVQRVGSVDMGTLNWTHKTLSNNRQMFTTDSIVDIVTCKDGNVPINALCELYRRNIASTTWANGDMAYHSRDSKRLAVVNNSYENAAEFKAAMSGIMLLYELAEPVETSLAAEETQAYSALHSYKPNTTVINNSGVSMAVGYFRENSAVPMNMGVSASGKILAVNEYGCVVPDDVSSVVFVGNENTGIAKFNEEYNKKKACFMRRSNAGEGTVTWVARSITSNRGLFYTVEPNGNVSYGTLNNNGFESHTASGGEGSAFVGDANTTVAEFFEASQAGKACFMMRNMGGSGAWCWMLVNVNTSLARFHSTDSSGNIMYGTLMADGTWDYETKKIITEERVMELINAALASAAAE